MKIKYIYFAMLGVPIFILFILNFKENTNSTYNLSINQKETEKKYDLSNIFEKTNYLYDEFNLAGLTGRYFISDISKEKNVANKIFIIEKLYSSDEIIGHYKDIYNILLRENNKDVIKSLSKLFMLSIDDNRKDAIKFLNKLIFNKKTSASIVDYIPEYFSYEEISEIYKVNQNKLSERNKDLLLSYYINNSLMNGSDPFLDPTMKEIYNRKNNNLPINLTEILSEIIVSGKDNSDFIQMQKDSDFTRTELRKIPENMNEEFLTTWFDSLLLTSRNDEDKTTLIKDLASKLTTDEKNKINNLYPNTF